MATIMHWQRGFKRIRLIGTVSLAIGVLLLLSAVVTVSLGYAPDPGMAPMFNVMFPLGMVLIVLGLLLWLTTWVLAGFLPDEAATRAGDDTPPRARFYR